MLRLSGDKRIAESFHCLPYSNNNSAACCTYMLNCLHEWKVKLLYAYRVSREYNGIKTVHMPRVSETGLRSV